MTSPKRTPSVLAAFDAATVSAAARAEARSREHSLPVVSLYRWWARRTVAVSTGLLDATAATLGKDRLVVADPFAGGGVIAMSALLRGHRVVAQELDPWAARNLATMATPGDADALASLESDLAERCESLVGLYDTTMRDGEPARMSHTFRVATTGCPTKGCRTTLRLYPAAIVTFETRVDRKPAGTLAWMACPAGHLHRDEAQPHHCPTCQRVVDPAERYTTGRTIACVGCGESHDVMGLLADATWEPVLVQRVTATRMEFAKPTKAEKTKAGSGTPIALGPIPDGRETRVLTRAGFADFADLYPTRQLQVLTGLLDAAAEAEAEPWVRDVARSCIIGAAEFAGHATRWDPRYLKPYETIAAHRYAVATLTVEIDAWGERGRGTVLRRLRAAAKASRWLGQAGAPKAVTTRGSGGTKTKSLRDGLTVVTGSSTTIPLANASTDLVLTDPPYHDDVQYAELASLFRAWDGKPLGRLTGDVTAVPHGVDTDARFQQALTDVFIEARRVTTDDGHLVLSFANRKPEAWVALFAALEAAGWHGAGYTLVHAENETDYAKAGRRACALDVIIDLVTTPVSPTGVFRPATLPAGQEAAYCAVAGEWALRVGRLSDTATWIDSCVAELAAAEFLSPAKTA